MSCTCKNCGNVFEGNFCNNCGQAADTHQINTAFLAHDLQHGLLHVDGGIFYSARELFKRPGHAIRDYIDGKRIKHYRPVSMVLVLASLYAMFYHMLSIDVLKGLENGTINYGQLDEWIIHHFSIITLLIIPILSAASWLVFRRQGYNFMEHLILNSFYSSQKLWLRLLTLPVVYLIDSHETRLHFLQWLLLADVFLMLWCYGQFFSSLPRTRALLLAFLSYLLSQFVIWVLMGLVLVEVVM